GACAVRIGGKEKVNKHTLARFLVVPCAALFGAALALPARAQSYSDGDGRYIQEPAPDDEEVPQEVAPYDQGQDGVTVENAPVPNPEGYVIADDCATGCDATSWSAPYVASSWGTTIVFGAPLFRLGHWYRPYFHRPYRAYSYSRPYRSWRGGYAYHGY